ncbi:hypothetical protein MAPG_04871 [Magnaporthiopsis poae ATCC 64411]|uniref:Uncharacterized protein n=1 Tax=Magnaporthiopsis poae (strain ATCC 64411 / 73-15) TaxID=644358 RepID=A0A0C4DXW4_MAGP6|nr:hypothetical protein MAPG_04871 [Magnaporthiopsis poae ATCC 64411]
MAAGDVTADEKTALVQGLCTDVITFHLSRNNKGTVEENGIGTPEPALLCAGGNGVRTTARRGWEMQVPVAVESGVRHKAVRLPPLNRHASHNRLARAVEDKGEVRFWGAVRNTAGWADSRLWTRVAVGALQLAEVNRRRPPGIQARHSRGATAERKWRWPFRKQALRWRQQPSAVTGGCVGQYVAAQRGAATKHDKDNGFLDAKRRQPPTLRHQPIMKITRRNLTSISCQSWCAQPNPLRSHVAFLSGLYASKCFAAPTADTDLHLSCVPASPRDRDYVSDDRIRGVGYDQSRWLTLYFRNVNASEAVSSEAGEIAACSPSYQYTTRCTRQLPAWRGAEAILTWAPVIAEFPKSTAFEKRPASSSTSAAAHTRHRRPGTLSIQSMLNRAFADGALAAQRAVHQPPSRTDQYGGRAFEHLRHSLGLITPALSADAEPGGLALPPSTSRSTRVSRPGLPCREFAQLGPLGRHSAELSLPGPPLALLQDQPHSEYLAFSIFDRFGVDLLSHPGKHLFTLPSLFLPRPLGFGRPSAATHPPLSISATTPGRSREASCHSRPAARLSSTAPSLSLEASRLSRAVFLSAAACCLSLAACTLSSPTLSLHRCYPFKAVGLESEQTGPSIPPSSPTSQRAPESRLPEGEIGGVEADTG